MKVLRTYNGSTMDLQVYSEPTANSYGLADAVGKDSISVFDAKEHLKDLIPEKGRAEQLQSFISDLVVKQKTKVPTTIVGFKEPNIVVMNLARLLPKEAVFHGQTCYLTDGEYIIRYILNEDSSVVKKYNKKELTLEQIGWSKFPELDVMLSEPVFNITHKFLKGDPYFDMSNNMRELTTCTGLSVVQVNQVWNMQREYNQALVEYARSLDTPMDVLDGKNEVVVNPAGEVEIADFGLTQDGYRVLINILQKKVSMSKQFFRNYEQWINHDWFVEFEVAKKTLPFEKWPDAPATPRKVIEVLSKMYKSFTEAWGAPFKESHFNGRDFWHNTPSLEDVYHEMLPIQKEIDECKSNFAKK